MTVHPTPLNQAFTIEIDPIQDERGFFARSFCKQIFQQNGIIFDAVQCNIADNNYRKTLRGMHFQKPPFCEDKLVTCINGAIYDVIIDLNRNSSTFCHWFGVELSAENQMSLYVPKGFAHGYMTLTDHARVYYMVSQYYSPGYESGVRWDDPAFGIQLPYDKDLLISEKDRHWSNFSIADDGMIFNEDGEMLWMQKRQ